MGTQSAGTSLATLADIRSVAKRVDDGERLTIVWWQDEDTLKHQLATISVRSKRVTTQIHFFTLEGATWNDGGGAAAVSDSQAAGIPALEPQLFNAWATVAAPQHRALNPNLLN